MPVEGVASPVTTAGVLVVSTALLPVTWPVSSKKTCAARSRPRLSKFSEAKPSGLMNAAWQPLHTVPGASVIDSITSRVVWSVDDLMGVLAALGGGGGITSQSNVVRMNTPFMMGRVLAVAVERKAARVS